MNLSDYEKLDAVSNYLNFKETGETHYLRFLYTSGGDAMGEDIEIRRKKWNDEKKKYEYDTPDGQLVASLKCIEYDADGKNPRVVIWERSAYFCKNTLLPMWKNYPRIIDGVWKITATNPKTMDATYALFPVMGADTTKYPIIEENIPVKAPAEVPDAPAQPVKPAKKKYWEE